MTGRLERTTGRLPQSGEKKDLKRMVPELERDSSSHMEKKMHCRDIKVKIKSMNNVIGKLRQRIHECIVQGDILKERKLWRTMDTLMDRRLNLVNAYLSLKH